MGCARRLWSIGGSTTTNSTGAVGSSLYLDVSNNPPSNWTFYLECPLSSQSTAAVILQTARTSTGRWAAIPGSSAVYSLSSAALVVVSFANTPLTWVRPYLQTLGSTGTTIRIEAVGTD